MEATLAEGMRGVLSAEQRVRLVAGLKAFQGERSRSALLQVVRGDPEPHGAGRRARAVGGMLDAEELFLTATRALADPHRDVRHAAIGLFRRVAPEKALPALIRQLKGDDDPVTLQAVAEQAEADFDAFVDLALGVALDGQEAIMVARVARYMHHPGLARVLGVIARSETPEVREAVARAWAGPARHHRRGRARGDDHRSHGLGAARRRSRRGSVPGAGTGSPRCSTIPIPGSGRTWRWPCSTPPDRGVTRAGSSRIPTRWCAPMLFAVRLLRGDTGEPPAAMSISRPAAATADSPALAPRDWLRETARGALDARGSGAAPPWRSPSWTMRWPTRSCGPTRSAAIRDQVTRMLASWRESPEPAAGVSRELIA